jgi:NAD(P)-dependent dehydrogenase (short-subunit alcohol dehydrogenase family)
MDELNGRTAVITGAASGIGLALARRFGAAGMQLALADVENGPLDDAVASLRESGVEAAGFHCDVSDLDQSGLWRRPRGSGSGTSTCCVTTPASAAAASSPSPTISTSGDG